MPSNLPRVVNALLHIGDGAWLVGGAADPNNQDPRDYDILVPFHLWHSVAPLIPEDAKINSFKGFKFLVPRGGPTRNMVEVDIWPGDLSWLVQRPMFRFAYHPLSGTLIKKE